MKYLFDMGEVWHVYADIGDEWIYCRMEQVSEKTISKSEDVLPGPLGRLDELKQLELSCKSMEEKVRIAELAEERAKEELAKRSEEFDKKYAELMNLAEELQKEGKLWRQRYLDLAYQVSPKGM